MTMSSGQRRLWVLQQLEPDSAGYNITVPVHFPGGVDAGALTRTLAGLTSRHRILATRYDERPEAVHVPEFAVPVTWLADTGEDWASRAARLAVVPFDLSAAPPVRAHVLTDGEDAVLVLVMHHILIDGWSIRLLVGELVGRYRAALRGTEPALDPVPQFEDVAESAEPDPRHLDHWRRVLTGVQPLELPLDRAREGDRGDAGNVEFALSAESTARLRVFAMRQRCAFPGAVAALFQVLLAEFSGQQDITIGSVLTGRDDPAMAGVIGFFVNTFALRTEVAGSFREVLRATNAALLAAAEHQRAPFEQVVDMLGLPRASGRNPVFDVVLAHHGELTDPPAPVPTGEITRLDWREPRARFDLELGTCVIEGRLLGTLNYRAALFERATVEALAARFVELAEEALADPDLPVARLPARSCAPRVAGRDRPVAERGVDELFRARVQAAPDAVAVRFAGTDLTYAQLDRASNGVARRLAARGVGARDVVAVRMARSADLVVALLGIVKAGAAYLPIDQDDPDARVAAVLARSGARHVLTEVAEETSDTAPEVTTGPDHALYVMYTSGSTGVPKGVVVSHRAVAELAEDGRWSAARERVLLHSAHTFDAVTFELWVPLLNGGCVVVAPPGITDGAVLRTAIDRDRVRCVWLTAGLFRVLAEESPEAFLGLREVWTGGDVVSPDAVRKVHRSCPDVLLFNGYGPTETTTFAVSHRIDPADRARTVPIGQPLDNTRCHVLGPGLQHRPTGAVGELYIAGTGLADGYLGRAGLTAERFVADLHGPPGERMYRTGDLVRWTAAGVLEFVGRADGQVKVRGFRVETAEVERVLADDPSVADVAVVAREDVPGEKRLVAYVIPGAATPVVADLRAAAARRLPAYMVPSAVVVVDRLPLTANGKLDRRALPAPAAGNALGSGAGTARRDALSVREELLCGLFAELLGVPEVGVDEDFFALGGHSLLATRLVSRIRSVFGTAPGVRTVFDHPTAAGLAVRLGRVDATVSSPRPVPRPAVVPLSFAQRRLWFLEQAHGPSPTYNVPLGLRLRGPLDHAALRLAVNDVVARHEALRTVLPAVDGEPRQDVRSRVHLDLPVVEVAEDRLQERLDALARHTFDLTTDLPVRATLLRFAPDGHLLLLLIHHVACDGWSLGVVCRDLSRAYAARLEGRAPDWAPVPVQYVDYTLWQRDLLGDPGDPTSRAARQAAYWRRTLAGLPDELALPTDRTRPERSSHRGGSVPVHIGPEIHRGVREVAAAARVTPAMVLQAGLAVLLAKLGAGTDVPVGGVVAGRTDDVLADVVGFFVNTQVLRHDLSGRPSFTDLLARVRETNLGADEHQDLAFEQVVEVVNPPRSLSRHPLFQVMLAVRNTVEHDLALPGVTATVMPARVGTAKFDLSFNLAISTAGVDGVLEYSGDLFDEPTAARLVERYRTLLAGLVGDPAADVLVTDVLSESERACLARWNATAHDVADRTLVELLEERIAATPHAVAVRFAGEELTYAELGDRTAELAARLVALGARPGRVVAVAHPRSIDLVVALVATLRSGAAYLPLDPDLPAERLAMMESDARPVVVLGRDELTGPENSGRVERPATDSPAYVIYTSGSTGRPKGVLVEHRAIVNRLLWMQHEFGLTARDRVLQKTPVGFDVSVWEFFWPLVRGATLVVAEPGGHRDPRYLAELIRAEGVTTVHFVPSMLDVFLAEPTAARCHSLRRVICSGEVLPAALVRRCAEVLDAPLVNLYGPTEAAVDVTAWWCDPADDPVPIGHPVWNTATHVLDGGLRRTPVGVPGELYLAGVQLARGYVNRPGQTAQRFVADPFGPPGSRMYRTGDLVRRAAGGELVYLGRLDDQVKLRGVRIELGEIDATLAEHDGVRRAVTVLHEDRLVGYLVPDDETAGPVRRLAALERTRDLGDVHRHLLPNGMVVLGRNRAEVEFLYEEIFEREEYLRHGVRIGDGAVVLDVGAHIGMFSLFAHAKARDVRVYSVEPIPDLYRELGWNRAVHDVRGGTFPCGAGASVGSAVFRFYPELSVLSGRFGDAEADRALVAGYALGTGTHDIAGDIAGDIAELIADRLGGVDVPCAVRPVSDLIEEAGLDRVDLLKVDVEKSELEVLRGVRAEHWPMIRQVVVEVHDIGTRVEEVTRLLERHGFLVAADGALGASGLVNLFGVRDRAARGTPKRPRWQNAEDLLRDVRRTAGMRLPGHLVPAELVVVDELRLSVNGKLDRRALPAPRRRPAREHVDPRTPGEELLCALFAELLDGPIGATDNFFERGGHSLLAARLVNGIRATFGVDLPIGVLFANPTPAELDVVLSTESASASTAVLLPIRGAGTGTPLFLVHPGSGLSWCYAGLARHLPRELPLYGLQSRLMTDAQYRPAALEDLVADYLAEIRRVQPSGPYRLAGWSFGGNVAHALATTLQADGERVSRLVVLDGYPYAGEPDGVQDLSLDEVRARYLRHGALAGLGDEQADRVAHAVVVHTRLAVDYRPAVFDGPVDLVRARGHADLPHLRPEAWKPFVSGTIAVHELPATHHDLLRPDLLGPIASILAGEGTRNPAAAG